MSNIQIVELDPADDDLVASAFEVLRAAHAADAPEAPAPHWGNFSLGLVHPDPAEHGPTFVAVRDGEAVGLAEAGYPRRENLHFGWASIHVHPDHRRQGIGSDLLNHFIEDAKRRGRTTLTIDTRLTWEDGVERSKAGQLFAEKHGFEQALTWINRRCAVDALEPEAEQALLEQAQAAAGDAYEIVSWIGRTPEHLVDTMARIDSTILEEVPLGDLELGPETIDAELKNARADRNEAMGVNAVQTIAIDKATGEAVANTAVFAYSDPEYPDAFQGITIVNPEHRGHRLGTLLKILNLRLVRENFPQVRHIWTDNADVNAPMIGINVALGYEILDGGAEFQRKLDA